MAADQAPLVSVGSVFRARRNDVKPDRRWFNRACAHGVAYFFAPTFLLATSLWWGREADPSGNP